MKIYFRNPKKLIFDLHACRVSRVGETDCDSAIFKFIAINVVAVSYSPVDDKLVVLLAKVHFKCLINRQKTVVAF